MAASTSASAPTEKPFHDVLAGAMARAASQSTIHPLDTMKVRMQAGSLPGAASSSSGSSAGARSYAAKAARLGAAGGGAAAAKSVDGALTALRVGVREVASLYKGVVSAATAAGVIIGAYFAFYSTSKRALKERTTLSDGQVAFVSGAIAAVGSSVVKVPMAVCIRSVQAGVYPNAVAAGKAITAAAGPRGLFTGFLPTLLEDVPDMAVKFAVYETLRPLHAQMLGGRQPSTLEDLLMGGVAGATAAAATTPLDVVKTRMMCSASSRPTLRGAVAAIVAEGRGPSAFFRGVVPRAVSNGLNSAVFFCFFEAIRRNLVVRQQEEEQQRLAAAAAAAGATGPASRRLEMQPLAIEQASSSSSSAASSRQHGRVRGGGGQLEADGVAPADGGKGGAGGGSGRLACLSLALPIHAWHGTRSDGSWQ